MSASGSQEAGTRRVTRERARLLRRQLTPAEALLWTRLRGRRFLDWKFVRQAPVGPRVTPRAYGRDWRYPITSGWRE